MPGLDEFGLIRLLTSGRGSTSGQPADGVSVGIGDDAAVLDGRNGYQWVASCDTMVQDVHFKPETMTYYAIGFKAMASNISDMAAMGAMPRFALVALSVPKAVPEQDLQELYDGLYDCAGRYGVAIVGGDTTGSPVSLTVTVTVLGEVEAGRALLRSSARPGDVLFITGELGMSAAGLDYLLKRGRSAGDLSELTDDDAAVRALIEAHQRPLPQVQAGRLLVESGLGRALNDISDGLASEVWELAEASCCRIELDESAIPFAQELVVYAGRVGTESLQWILYGGEDYHLAGTVPEQDAQRLEELFREKGLSFYPIGRVQAGDKPEVTLKKRDGTVVPLGKKGYNHFQSS
jgi:thiamine-monophosphate kinase